MIKGGTALRVSTPKPKKAECFLFSAEDVLLKGTGTQAEGGVEQHRQRKFPSAGAPAAAVPFHPRAPWPTRLRTSPSPVSQAQVVNTRRPRQRAPPPGLRRASQQVMNGLTMPSSFSHAGTRTRAPQRRRFNTPVTATANRINGPPSERKKGAHASQASPKRFQTGRHNPFSQVDFNEDVRSPNYIPCTHCIVGIQSTPNLDPSRVLDNKRNEFPQAIADLLCSFSMCESMNKFSL